MATPIPIPISSTTPIRSRLIRGDSWVLPLVFTQAGESVDISGWTLSFTAKTSLDDSDDDAQVAFDYVFPDNEETQVGIGTVTIPASKMRSLIPGKAHIDFQVTIPAEPEPIVTSYSLGKIPVLADSTQRVPTDD